MTLVDSSVWVDYFSGALSWQTERLHDLLIGELIIIGDIILMEVLMGFRKDADFKLARKLLCDLPCINTCGPELAVKAAANFRLLRAEGITIRKTIDVIIGTCCIENGFSLLHRDRDFDAMAGLLGMQVVTS